MQIFLGLLITFTGFMVVAKSEWLLNNFGRIGFFDKYMGSSGGSRLGYKLIGITAIFIGILITTDLIGSFVMWALSPLIGQNAFGG